MAILYRTDNRSNDTPYIGSCMLALFLIGLCTCAIQAVSLKPGQFKFATDAEGRLSQPALPALAFGAYCCICWLF